MGEFKERREIDRMVHPDKAFMTPNLFPDPVPMWERPEHRPDPNDQGTKDGSSARYIQNVADGSKDPNFDPKKKIGSLDSKADRFRAINEMSSQNGEGGDEQCGAYVLLAGAMVGGGTKGVEQLMNSVEAYNKKHPGSIDAKELAADQEEMKKLREKMKIGEELTAGDLNMVAGNVYDMMKIEGREGGANSDAGTKRSRVEGLFKESPELRKLWKDNDLSYDSVSTTGAKDGGHAILGIGHAKGDKDHTGEHAAVYDPFRRTQKDAYAGELTQEAVRELEQLRTDKKDNANPQLFGYYDQQIAKAQRQYDVARKHEIDSKQNLGQVITDPFALGMYRNADRQSMEMTDKGTDTKSLKEAPLPEHSLFEGMY